MSSKDKFKVGITILMSGFISGIFFRQPDPMSIIVKAIIEVLKSLGAPTIFILLILLVFFIYKVSEILEILRIILMGSLAILTFVFGFLAGAVILYNQTLGIIFLMIGIFFAFLFSLSY